MRLLRLIVVLAAGLTAGPAAAADLAAIDRTIKKEPAYTGTPAYLLLAFGPAADPVWVVADGDTLYVDRNGDGDLTGADEKVAAAKDGRGDPAAYGYSFDAGEVRVGGRVHKGLTVTRTPLKLYADNPSLKAFRPLQDALKADPDGHAAVVSADVDVPGLTGGGLGGRLSFTAGFFDAAGVLRFARSPKDAPVVHLGGPLQVTLYGWKTTLTLGRDNDLVLVVGSPGRGPGTLAMLAYDGTIPDAARPKVEVAWPAAKGGEPVKELYELPLRC